MTFITSLSPTVIWLLLGVALLGIELATPGLFFFVSFAFGCLFGAFSAFLGYSLVIQCCITLIVSLIQFNSMRRVLKRFSDERNAPTNIHALIGKTGHVTQSITHLRNGRVRIGSEEWVASSVEPINEGVTVEILNIEGNRVIVEAFDNRASHNNKGGAA